MLVFFVIDVMAGKVVRAYRGERDRYRSIAEFSSIVNTDDPIYVVKEIKPKRLYVADLDAIMGRRSGGYLMDELAREVDELLVDRGFRDPRELVGLCYIPVLGTETFDLRRLDEVECEAYVSLDFKEGELLGSLTLESAMNVLNSYDFPVIVLTIDNVGTSKLDLDIVERVLDLSQNPVLVGGGVGSMEDLLKLKEMECYGVLVSTAVHIGRIGLDIIRNGKV